MLAMYKQKSLFLFKNIFENKIRRFDFHESIIKDFIAVDRFDINVWMKEKETKTAHYYQQRQHFMVRYYWHGFHLYDIFILLNS